MVQIYIIMFGPPFLFWSTKLVPAIIFVSFDCKVKTEKERVTCHFPLAIVYTTALMLSSVTLDENGYSH